MKLAIALSVISLSLASAAPGKIPTCGLQSQCIEFTASKVANTCNYIDDNGNPSDCVVEVCMTINTGKDGCPKGAGGTISHVCDASDANGCPRYDNSGSEPSLLLDSNSNDGTCGPVTGQGSGSITKCDNVSNIKMCQRGMAGEDLLFIIKDSNDGVDASDSWSPIDADGSKCKPYLTCELAEQANANCGGNQADKERVWTYTIPETYCTSPETCSQPYLSGPSPSPPSSPSSPSGSEPSGTPAPTYSCVQSVCEANGPNYYPGCGSTDCDFGIDSCITQTQTGPCDIGSDLPSDLLANPCYIGTFCSADGLSCDHTFESTGTACLVPGEDPDSFDSVCVESPVCTAVASADFGPNYAECIRPIKAFEPCTLLGDEGVSGPLGRGVCHAGDFCTETGKCEPTAHPETKVCRESENCCDQEEYCPGDVASGFDCPEDTVKPHGSECRASCPNCPADQLEVCDGTSKICPRDIVFADELCLFAGQTTPVGSMTVEIIRDSDGTYTLDMQVSLTAPLAEDAEENVKIYVGLEPPKSSPGSYNIKGHDIDSVVRNLSSLGYSPCDDSEGAGFYIAAHFDMADGETAWALPCDNTVFMGDMASSFCTTTKKGKQSCRGWGKFFNIAPCCPSAAGCADTCPSGLPGTDGEGTQPPSDNVFSDKECNLTCNGETVQTLTCVESATVTATCDAGIRMLGGLRGRSS